MTDKEKPNSQSHEELQENMQRLPQAGLGTGA